MARKLAGDPPTALPDDEAFWEKFEARAAVPHLPHAPLPRPRACAEQKGELIGRGHFAHVRIARDLDDERCELPAPRSPPPHPAASHCGWFPP